MMSLALAEQPIHPSPAGGFPAREDTELSKLAAECAELLVVPRTILIERSREEAYAVGAFPAEDSGVEETFEGLAGSSLEEVLTEIRVRGSAHVEAIVGAGGILLGALLLPAHRGWAWTPAGRSVRCLLTGAYEGRLFRGRAAELEQELWRSDSRLRELSETASTGITLLDPEGSIIEVNAVAADILGDRPDRLRGRSFHSFVPPEDLDAMVKEFRLRMSGDPTIRETEIQIVRGSGERRLLRIRTSVRLDDFGVGGIYLSARDITDEQAREVQLRRAERFANIAPLLSGVCHELNNPLTSIKSFAELLLLDDRIEGDREALEIVKREAARAARIVTDLRLVARQTQEEGASVARFDLNELIREQCEASRREFEQERIEVRMDLTSALKPICGVRAHLERVIEQLLSNAVEALRDMDRPKSITIQTYSSLLGVAVRVQDTGRGIAPDDVERIFDPFWTTRMTGEGTGLGLSLVHGIVTEHHGRIRVDGGLGRGATFTVEFPVADEIAATHGFSAPAEVRSPLRIMIVEDEGPIRYSLSRYMGRRGHLVCEAAEGGQALELLANRDQQPFDIIVADLRMPGLGGDQLYRRLRDAGDGMEERLIFITGDADGAEAAALVKEAGVPVVLKPFELAEIALIIETHAETLSAV